MTSDGLVVELVERRGAGQLEVLGASVPDAMQAAANWLRSHPAVTVTSLNVSSLDSADSGRIEGSEGLGPGSPVRLIVGLVDDDTEVAQSTVLYVEAERPVPDSHPKSFSPPPAGSDWTVDLAELVLRQATPAASALVRVLVDEGGYATVALLRERTGQQRLNPMTHSLNSAARRAAGEQRLGGHRWLALPCGDPARPSQDTTYAYELPAELVPLFSAALQRLGR